MARAIIKCTDVSIYLEYAGQQRLRCKLLMNHPKFGGDNGDWTITSQLKMIDFERKIAITQNNVYDWS